MKSLFSLIFLLFISFNIKAQEHTLTQFSNPENVFQLYIHCGDGELVHYGRVFDLASYGIFNQFTLTKLNFFGGATQNTTIWLDAALVEGEPTIASNLTPLDINATHTFTEMTPLSWHTVEFQNQFTFDGGKKYFIALAFRFFEDNDLPMFYMGLNNSNQNPQTSPSYLGYFNSGCSEVPTNVLDMNDGNGQPFSWIFSITGTTDGMNTVEINSHDLSISPNPVKDEISILMSNEKIINNIEIINLSGQSLYNAKRQKSLNLSFLIPGIYILKVEDQNGVIHMKKFIKK